MSVAADHAERLIVVDWGTSNFRAFLVDIASGDILDSRRSASGLKALSQPEFPHYCASQTDDWRDGGRVPVYLAGMVGSARGWSEAPQLELPVSADDLADRVVAAPGLDNVWIVPGVKQVTADHVDVMRGEEVQAFGALALADPATRAAGVDCCLPGTHSKWARLEHGRMTAFTTLMTGELYHAVRFHTLPGEPARDEAPFDAAAFRLGLSRAEAAGGVMHALFEARSRHLYAGLAAGQVGSFLSGVLIGEEVRAMRGARPDITTVQLVGAETLRESYTLALEAAGLHVNAIDSDRATLAGVSAIAARHASRPT
ncbi:2-dehydro-3-deoxygalactonokinase [Salinicola avicenniae]|uniref:2-dehydro-3-deoxygalactonokinase n=1 Tax=Salinicola avicenniae TaxID=2916836 RepID=UPI00207469D6|nr:MULTISPECIES: 2-dehydro-3-deoxygalactonokinase [unclassified Salinicola]